MYCTAHYMVCATLVASGASGGCKWAHFTTYPGSYFSATAATTTLPLSTVPDLQPLKPSNLETYTAHITCILVGVRCCQPPKGNRNISTPPLTYGYSICMRCFSLFSPSAKSSSTYILHCTYRGIQRRLPDPRYHLPALPTRPNPKLCLLAVLSSIYSSSVLGSLIDGADAYLFTITSLVQLALVQASTKSTTCLVLDRRIIAHSVQVIPAAVLPLPRVPVLPAPRTPTS